MGLNLMSLPTELRHYIWTYALGEHGDTPTMVPFRTARPFLLEEEDDDDDMFMGEDDIGEVLSEEQFEQIRQLALHQVSEQNGGGPSGPVAPAPTTLPSNGVARAVGNETDGGAHGEGSGRADGKAGEGADRQAAVDATNEVPVRAWFGNDEYGEDDDDEDEEDDDEDAESFDSDVGDFEPDNPYSQERVWDDEVVIPVYLPPLLLVNREARDVTLGWLEKHDIQLTRNTIIKGEIDTGFVPTKDGLPPYTRKYNPERDHLYVDRYYWRRFCDRLQMRDMVTPRDDNDADADEDEEPPVHDIGPGIKYLALPAFTMYYSVRAVSSIMEYLPGIKQVVCLFGELPDQRWKPHTIYETVQRGGQPKTQVTNVLMPRWDHVRISETLPQAEVDRRREDTERIQAEREKDKQERHERRERRQRAAEEGKDDGFDYETSSDDYDDDEDEDEEMDDETGGPLVTMCVRDPTNDTKIHYERGYLSNWMDEIYNELALCELPDHIVDEEDGSVTLPISPCNAVRHAPVPVRPPGGNV